MIPYNQRDAKITNTESFKLKSCMRKAADAIDKRFCFDIIPEDRWIVCSISSIAHCACPGLTLCTLCKHSQRRTGSCGWRLWMGPSPCKLRFIILKPCFLDSSLSFAGMPTLPAGSPATRTRRSWMSLGSVSCRTAWLASRTGGWRTRACTGWLGSEAR